MIKSVVREHKWSPEVISDLFIDNVDYKSLIYWYNDCKDLAKELLKNPNDIIVVSSDNFEMNNAKIPLTSVYLGRHKAIIVKQSFRDAFDGGSYSSDVVKLRKDGDLNIVIL